MYLNVVVSSFCGKAIARELLAELLILSFLLKQMSRGGKGECLTFIVSPWNLYKDSGVRFAWHVSLYCSIECYLFTMQTPFRSVLNVLWFLLYT
jgi:hypothetical protein